MTLTGEHFIGARRVAAGPVFRGIAAATGEPTADTFGSAGADEVAVACALAATAFPVFAHSDPEARAAFLETIAANIEALGTALIDQAHLESGLPIARLTGERGRTCGQLRLFAAEVRDGGWQDIRIDPAMPDRQPLPRPDLRLRKVAIGPVAVFGASNFPLAFSVAGGDTASALAAGCPVVVKGHAAHPGTSEMVASAIAAAVASTGLPEGVFSMLMGNTNELGAALVADPRIKAVGFTGSRGGGLALMAIAASRPEPIPVYAEMSAVNPVILMPGALADRAEALGTAYVGSLTMGAGQFCTNPGLVLAIDGPDLARFTAAAVEAMGKAAAQTMLTPGIHAAYARGVETLGSHTGVETLGLGLTGEAPAQGQAALFTTSADMLERDKTVSEEVFGAASVLVKCADTDALARAIATLEGQLTATVHFAASDEPAVAELLPLIETKAGRILANGWPTGVEVSHAMVHGGPFPATSDGRSTSVGTLAIDRFVRPVCYQDFPDSLLPAPLRDGALAGVRHRHDGAHRV